MKFISVGLASAEFTLANQPVLGEWAVHVDVEVSFTFYEFYKTIIILDMN